MPRLQFLYKPQQAAFKSCLKTKTACKALNAMKTCMECNEKLVGREDKKFCSDGCRNSYNNKINKDTTNLMRNTNNKLRRNYRILCTLNSDNKTRTTRSKMLMMGFDFSLITCILHTKTGNTYYFVYNQGYLALENDYFMLVRKDIQ